MSGNNWRHTLRPVHAAHSPFQVNHWTPPPPPPTARFNGVNIGPIWGREDPGGPHVGSMNFAIWACPCSRNRERVVLGFWVQYNSCPQLVLKLSTFFFAEYTSLLYFFSCLSLAFWLSCWVCSFWCCSSVQWIPYQVILEWNNALATLNLD